LQTKVAEKLKLAFYVQYHFIPPKLEPFFKQRRINVIGPDRSKMLT